MQLSTLRPLDAVRGPNPPLAAKGDVVRRMPVPRQEDWEAVVDEGFDQPVESRNDPVAVEDREGSSGTEVILDVDYDQSCVQLPVTSTRGRVGRS